MSSLKTICRYNLILFLLLFSTALWGADLDQYYKTVQNSKEVPDRALNEIFRQETSASKILEAVGSCKERIQDKYNIFYQTANLALMCGKYDLAQQYFQLAFDANQEAWYSLYMSAALLYEQGEFELPYLKFRVVQEKAQAPLKDKAKAMGGAVMLSQGKSEAGIRQLASCLATSSDDSVLYLVYDISSAFLLSEIKNAAAKKLKAGGFEGRLASEKAAFPITPSRIFLSSDYSDTTISKAVESQTRTSTQAEQDASVRRPVAIQVGSFGNETNARNMEKKLKDLGVKPVVNTVKSGDKTLYKVSIPVDADMDVNNTVLLLKDNGIESYYVF
ncbi:MAG: SPOR domain-containing protein [Spirochaetia bacterium]|nr:SPOR domain-containing protein [Spirochaetia bacterium]